LVIRVIHIVIEHLHLVDHAELVEEAIGDSRWLRLKFHQGEEACVLSRENILLWGCADAYLWLCRELDKLRYLMAHLDLLAVLEARIDIPAKQVALDAADEEQIAMAECTERYLPAGIKFGNEAQVARVENVYRLVCSIYKYVF